MTWVMPLGYGAPEVLAPTQGVPVARSRIETSINSASFGSECSAREADIPLLKTEIPRHPRLSMGGSESCCRLNTLDKFAWVGAFSSGGIPKI